MNYPLIMLPKHFCAVSPLFIEGSILAANFATQPLDPKQWLSELFPDHVDELEPLITAQINAQYQQLKANQFALLSLLSQHAESREKGLTEFAQGFMSLWPMIEPQWQTLSHSDGSLRMLQALLTTLMLAIDEAGTHQQMKAAGYESLPTLAHMIEQLDLMVHEVALAANEAMLGAKAQTINPYKQVGRNDACPCSSGKKFKHCCGQ
ncbi:SEC-C metal-binding domain-containing protein [Vibrio metschnikovii]|uniref:SEC-C metal-binding domain-containing protein n=1 Tax=Vibrio metschnikovii TaxID=28172 RepID=UPI0016454143|nr:YecA family protein [Vibrio metschnikovii]MBC3620023.1 YecA family protein [Vibrio metschnikovii]